MRGILLLAFTIIVSTGIGQITISQTDFGGIGDTVFLATNSSIASNTSVGSTGSTSWNYANIGFGNFDTVIYSDPLLSHFAPLFPNSTEVITNELENTYIKNGVLMRSIDGESGDLFGDGNIYAVNYDPDIQILSFPANYTDSFTVTTQIDTSIDTSIVIPPVFNFDSIRIKRVFKVSSNIDAYGNVQTPTGTYNSLRQYRQWVEIDSIWTHSSGGSWGAAPVNPVTTTTTHYYTWYAVNEKHPIMHVEADAQNGNITWAQYKLGNSLSTTMSWKQNVDCNGACNGMTAVDVAGGVLPYTFQWSSNAGGQTNDSISGLCAGNYFVTVFDALGDSSVSNIGITEPTMLDIDTVAINPETSIGNDGSVMVNVNGGTPPYSYLWSTGDTLHNLTNLTTGNYYLNVTDANGCTDSAFFLVGSTAGMLNAILGSTTNASCNGNCDGELRLQVGGGNTPYTYNWTSNAPAMSDSIASGLCAGTYHVTVSDANADTVIITNMIVMQPSVLEADTVSVTHESSVGNDGAIDVMVTGGTMPYSYAWSNSANTEDIFGLTQGVYQLTVTDANNCSDVLTVTVLNTGTSTGITVFSTDFGNPGDIAYLAFDTSIHSLNLGGVGNVNWNFNHLMVNEIDTLAFLNPNNTVNGGNFPNANLVQARRGDTSYVNKSLTEMTIEGIVGDPFNLNIEAVFPFVPALKILEFPSGFNSSFTSQTILDSTIDTTVLVFTKIRIKRIIDVDSEIDAYGDMNIPAGTFSTIRQSIEQLSTDSVFGFGPLTGWQYLSDFSGKDTLYQFNWFAKGEKYPVVEAVAYDENANDLEYVAFKLGNNILLSITQKNDVQCFGDCNGTATVTAVSGTGPFTYYWDANAGNHVGATVTGLCPGSYSVIGVDANNDSVLTSVTIYEPADLVVSVDTIITETDPGNNGGVTISVVGGVKPYSYNWSGTGQSSASINGLVGNQTYNVTVTDANNCTETASAMVPTTVSVNELNVEKVQYFPNPVVDYLTITDLDQSFEVMRIVDVQGKLVKEQSINGLSSLTIDLTGLSEGSYVITLVNQDGAPTHLNIFKQ